ncbi:DUF4192 domain-containing protein [Actinoplanes regularis]|uniref:DUF4192 domain-containing protein n=1 Tax=Actinoplanes regularis TaxID=52697 RepID=A0A239IYK8_9ACTN|nr:DUF4192 domain-containing protein [Actinoplanes regularis]GIE91629.1 hypothetical protein Are01nite_81090 [Actinoplanes regularis]SNS98472.1 protein of unknown function [Actinoplanes regularis]
MTHPAELSLKDSTNVVAVVPYLLGYHPHDQLIILALKDSQVLFAAAAPLPYSSDPVSDATEVATRITAHGPDRVVLIGYGPGEAVATAVDQTIGAFTALDVAVSASFRVYDDWLWHLRCDDPECELGIPFDVSTTAVAAQATLLGYVAAEDVHTYATRLAPVTGDERKGMQTALAAAHRHLDDLAAGSSEEQIRTTFHDLVERLLREARTTYEQHRGLADSTTALLLALLSGPHAPGAVMKHVHGEDLDVRIWTDLTRRADPVHAAAPATLLALAALQRGNGHLARLAIERAQEAEPEDTLIQRLAEVISRGIAPADVRRLVHE